MASPAMQQFLDRALPVLAANSAVVGVAVGGSAVTGQTDAFSDLDLVIAVEPEAFEAVMMRREDIAQSLGKLVASFTGEHVGEPRLLICLYRDPLLHVDLKFVALPDAADRVEDPRVLWERDARLSAAMAERPAVYPPVGAQWIEDRIWVWLHYSACKLGRGELFEALDGLAFLRGRVLGPLALVASGARPQGVRRFETEAPLYRERLEATVARYDRADCIRAFRAAMDLYRAVRPAGLVYRTEAERTALAYLDEVERMS